jgi:hypothetical protein
MKKYLNKQYWMIKNSRGAQDNELFQSADEIIVLLDAAFFIHTVTLQLDSIGMLLAKDKGRLTNQQWSKSQFPK